jgi:hypothetical protein
MKKLLLLFLGSTVFLTGCMMSSTPSASEDGCKDIEHSITRDDCYVQRAVGYDDKSICENIDDDVKKGSCLLEIAVSTLDIEACNSLNGYIKDKCISDFSNQGFAKGVSDCNQHEDVDTCLAHQAEVRQNPRYCNKTSDYTACIASLMESAPADRLPCENVESSDRVACVLEMARILEDPSFCKSLTEESEVATCEDGMKETDTNTAAMYANMICVLNNPAVWEDLFDDKTPDQEAFDAIQTQLLYSDYGYSGEADARVGLQAVWGSDSFKKTVKDAVAKDCQDLADAGGVDIDALLNSSAEEVLGNR